MEGGSFSNFGSRFSAVHNRINGLQQRHEWREALFQIVAIDVAPRTFVLKVSYSFRHPYG
eukprot:7638641-Pyramimonas_sp.AAC.1